MNERSGSESLKKNWSSSLSFACTSLSIKKFSISFGTVKSSAFINKSVANLTIVSCVISGETFENKSIYLLTALHNCESLNIVDDRSNELKMRSIKLDDGLNLDSLLF